MLSILNAKDYDLPTILNLAQSNSNDIKLAKADLDFAQAQKSEALSLALPKINAQLDYNRNFLKNILFFTITDSAGQERTESFTASFNNAYLFRASLDQTIFGFGKIGNALKAANYFNTYADFQYNSSVQSIITNVKKAFYQVLLLQKVWEVAIQSEKSAEDNYENIKIKFEGGVVSEFDLLQAETRWQNAIPETMQARKNYEVAINNLKALVDIPLREEITIIGGLETFPPLPDSLDYQIVFEQRPDYNALLWEKKLQEKRVSIEKSNYYPTLTGNLTYIYNASSDEFRLDNENDNVVAGLTLNIPLFTGFFTKAQVEKARVDVARVTTRIAKANDEIRIEIQNIYLRLRESQERIGAAEKSIESAKRAFEIAQTRVDIGLATQLEFRESRVDLDRAQVNFFSATYDYLDAYFDWQRATGSVNMSGL
jgi:outer membrane protein TolC